MSAIDKPDTLQLPTMTDMLKSWMMVSLTFIFILLYLAALVGWVNSFSVAIVSKLEPIIFVIIGYYFGRVPAQQNENSLKEEINRQATKADAAVNAKEKAQQEREALEEKVKNAKTVLTSGMTEASPSDVEVNKGIVKGAFDSIETAIRVLNS